MYLHTYVNNGGGIYLHFYQFYLRFVICENFTGSYKHGFIKKVKFQFDKVKQWRGEKVKSELLKFLTFQFELVVKWSGMMVS